MVGSSRVPAATLASCVAPMSPAPQDSLRQMQLVPRQNLQFFEALPLKRRLKGLKCHWGTFHWQDASGGLRRTWHARRAKAAIMRVAEGGSGMTAFTAVSDDTPN